MPKKPDIFKMLDVKRKSLLRLPGNALKIWLYYWMREGQERLAWATEKDICELTGLHRDVMYDNRRWLIENGWLKKMTLRPSRHGEFATTVFRVKEGRIPESTDQRRRNNPERAKKMRAEKKRLGLEAIQEFVGNSPMGDVGSVQSAQSLQDASVINLRLPSANIREEVEPLEVDSFEVEPMLVGLQAIGVSNSKDEEKAQAVYDQLSQESGDPEGFSDLYHALTDQLPNLFGVPFIAIKAAPYIMTAAVHALKHGLQPIEVTALATWAKRHEFWSSRCGTFKLFAKQMGNFEESSMVAQWRSHMELRKSAGGKL